MKMKFTVILSLIVLIILAVPTSVFGATKQPVITTVEPSPDSMTVLTCDQLSTDLSKRAEQLMSQGGQCISESKVLTSDTPEGTADTVMSEQIVISAEALNQNGFGVVFKSVSMTDFVEGNFYAYATLSYVGGQDVYSVGVFTKKAVADLIISQYEKVNFFVVENGDYIATKNAVLEICRTKETCTASV